MSGFELSVVYRLLHEAQCLDAAEITATDKDVDLGGFKLRQECSIAAERGVLKLSCEEAGEHDLSFGFRLRFPNLKNAHVVMPAAVYAGNRFRSKPYAYSCIVCDPEDFRADLPNTISNVPRLPKIQLLAGDLSMPCIGVGDSESEQGYWIATDPRGLPGQPMLEAIEDEVGLLVSIMMPGVREGERYQGCGEHWVLSEDRGWSPKPGDVTELKIAIFEFEARTPPDLFRRLFEIRHDIWPAGGRHELPWSQAMSLVEEKFNRLHWDEDEGYYACGDRLTRYANWQVGWVGGGISSYALLAAGGPESQRRGMRTMDFMAGKGQSPSGFYWSFCVEGQVYSDMIDESYGHDWHLVRRSGDALYFLIKKIWLAEKLGIEKSEWRESARKCADAFVRLWNRESQFGQFVSQETGEIRVGATTSGAIAPAGLTLAYRLLGNPEYLRVAKESARYMVERFLNAGYTSGGPGEAAQCPDSESAFGLLESLVTLLEETGESEWLQDARSAAHLCASWVMPYDFDFPAESTFGRLDMRTTGSVWANAQNKHSAPGICTLSGVSLFKLFRATGDVRYLELLREIAHGVTQYLSRVDRPVFGMEPGYMCERVNTSDWEHPYTPVGEGFPFGCWCETSALLTYAELPGLYIQPDTGLVCVLDHADVVSNSPGDGCLEIELRNGTDFDMRLRVFTENSSQMSRPLGQDFMVGAQEVEIKTRSLEVLSIKRT